MNIDLFATPNMSEKYILGHVVIVIDVLRATSTIVTAFENGCRSVIPVTEVEEAVQMARLLGNKRMLLCGERDALLIPGFNLSNSPLEYSSAVVGGKTLIMSTTNGTRALNLVKAGDVVLLGSMLNAKAVAKRAVMAKKPITIVCAGTKDRYSLDDVLTAGCIIDRITQMGRDIALCDLGRSALAMYDMCKEDIQAALSGSTHFGVLKHLGLKADLDFCLREDAMTAVPCYADGVIRVTPNVSHSEYRWVGAY